MFSLFVRSYSCSFFFFNDTATTEIYTLSLHDALPIFQAAGIQAAVDGIGATLHQPFGSLEDRKSTRLNSSHTVISYAVFCLKKKKKDTNSHHTRKKIKKVRRRLHTYARYGLAVSSAY